MTFDEAMDSIKAGGAVRNPGMLPNWCIKWLASARTPYFINPQNGSTSTFQPNATDLERTDWEVFGAQGA